MMIPCTTDVTINEHRVHAWDEDGTPMVLQGAKLVRIDEVIGSTWSVFGPGDHVVDASGFTHGWLNEGGTACGTTDPVRLTLGAITCTACAEAPYLVAVSHSSTTHLRAVDGFTGCGQRYLGRVWTKDGMATCPDCTGPFIHLVDRDGATRCGAPAIQVHTGRATKPCSICFR